MHVRAAERFVRQRIGTVVAVVVFLAAAGSASGQMYGWHPETRTQLGCGADPAAPHLPLEKPCTFEEVPAIMRRETLRLTILKDETTLEDAVEADRQIGLRSLAYSADAAFNFNRRNVRSAATVTAVLQFRAIVGQRQAIDAALANEANRVRDRSRADFEKKYGTHYAATEERGAILNIVFTMNNVDETLVRALKGVSAVGVPDIEAKEDFWNEVSNAGNTGRLEMSWETYGAPPGMEVPIVHGILLGREAREVEESLARFRRAVTFHTAVVTAFELRPIPVPGKAVPVARIDEDSLRKIVEAYRKARTEQRNLKLRGNVFVLPEADKRMLDKADRDYEQYLLALRKLHSEVLAAKPNDPGKFAPVELPPIPPDIPDEILDRLDQLVRRDVVGAYQLFGPAREPHRPYERSCSIENAGKDRFRFVQDIKGTEAVAELEQWDMEWSKDTRSFQYVDGTHKSTGPVGEKHTPARIIFVNDSPVVKFERFGGNMWKGVGWRP